jgi:hypothetical protein
MMSAPGVLRVWSNLESVLDRLLRWWVLLLWDQSQKYVSLAVRFKVISKVSLRYLILSQR